MADHLWIIPASGGTEDGTGYLNVQWLGDKWPITATPASVTVSMPSVFTRHTPVGDASLLVCNAKWEWTSQQASGSVTVGNQLLVGTVFSADLPLTAGGDDQWDTLDIWVKFRTSNKDRFEKFYLAANDGGSPPTRVSSGDFYMNVNNNTWYIGRLTAIDIRNWARDNMRASLVALGTTTSGNVGATDLEVEWIAIRLRDQV